MSAMSPPTGSLSAAGLGRGWMRGLLSSRSNLLKRGGCLCCPPSMEVSISSRLESRLRGPLPSSSSKVKISWNWFSGSSVARCSHEAGVAVEWPWPPASEAVTSTVRGAVVRPSCPSCPSDRCSCAVGSSWKPTLCKDLSMLPWLELSSMLLAPCLDPSMPWPVRSREKRRRRGGLGWEGRSEGLWVLGRREGLKLRREGEEGLRESREGLRDCETRCVRCQSSVAFSHRTRTTSPLTSSRSRRVAPLRSSVLGSNASPVLVASMSSSTPLPPLPPPLRGMLRAALHALASEPKSTRRCRG
mmetsp:Transcript_48268/g.116057  ORF Transcript_48268/g.116057 Transcript_48268/m.116057 type:complete len:301 (-) Transcript_48268:1628-2530(-)